MRSRRTSHATGIVLAVLALSLAFAGRLSAQTYRDVQAGRIESLPIGMTPEEYAEVRRTVEESIGLPEYYAIEEKTTEKQK